MQILICNYRKAPTQLTTCRSPPPSLSKVIIMGFWSKKLCNVLKQIANQFSDFCDFQFSRYGRLNLISCQTKNHPKRLSMLCNGFFSSSVFLLRFFTINIRSELVWDLRRIQKKKDIFLKSFLSTRSIISRKLKIAKKKHMN